LPANFEEKLAAFQQHVTGFQKSHSYHLSRIRNADETPLYFDMLRNYTVDVTGTKSGHEKTCVTVMLAELADGSKLPSYTILNHKNMPKEQLPTGISQMPSYRMDDQ
jgi:hypothetical protein